MTVVVHLVTDQDSEAPACAALLTRLATAFPAAEIELCAVLAHDTLAAGFCVAQLARSAAGDEQVIGHWVTETPDAAPRRLCVGRSLVGTLVVGPNEGFAWSFALPELRGLCFLDIDVPAEEDETAGALLATGLAHAHARHPHVVRGAVPRDRVPKPPVRVVAHVDREGTLKTTIAALPAPSGTPLDVRIGATWASAIASDGSIAPVDGQLLLAPATSEWPAAPGLGARYVELREIGGSAADRFASPRTGAPIEVTPARPG